MWCKKIYTQFTPSTGLNGPAGELAKIGILFINNGFFNGGRILTPESVSLISESYPPENTGTFDNPQLGIGWKRWQDNGNTFYGHGGGGPGYGAQLAVIPEKNLVIVICANDTEINRRILVNTIAGIDW